MLQPQLAELSLRQLAEAATEMRLLPGIQAALLPRLASERLALAEGGRYAPWLSSKLDGNHHDDDDDDHHHHHHHHQFLPFVVVLDHELAYSDRSHIRHRRCIIHPATFSPRFWASSTLPPSPTSSPPASSAPAALRCGAWAPPTTSSRRRRRRPRLRWRRERWSWRRPWECWAASGQETCVLMLNISFQIGKLVQNVQLKLRKRELIVQMWYFLAVYAGHRPFCDPLSGGSGGAAQAWRHMGDVSRVCFNIWWSICAMCNVLCSSTGFGLKYSPKARSPPFSSDFQLLSALPEGWEVYGNHSDRQLVDFAIDTWTWSRPHHPLSTPSRTPASKSQQLMTHDIQSHISKKNAIAIKLEHVHRFRPVIYIDFTIHVGSAFPFIFLPSAAACFGIDLFRTSWAPGPSCTTRSTTAASCTAWTCPARGWSWWLPPMRPPKLLNQAVGHQQLDGVFWANGWMVVCLTKKWMALWMMSVVVAGPGLLWPAAAAGLRSAAARVPRHAARPLGSGPTRRVVDGTGDAAGAGSGATQQIWWQGEADQDGPLKLGGKEEEVGSWQVLLELLGLDHVVRSKTAPLGTCENTVGGNGSWLMFFFRSGCCWTCCIASGCCVQDDRPAAGAFRATQCWPEPSLSADWHRAKASNPKSIGTFGASSPAGCTATSLNDWKQGCFEHFNTMCAGANYVKW